VDANVIVHLLSDLLVLVASTSRHMLDLIIKALQKLKLAEHVILDVKVVILHFLDVLSKILNLFLEKHLEPCWVASLRWVVGQLGIDIDDWL
jgi:hypothetical protein